MTTKNVVKPSITGDKIENPFVETETAPREEKKVEQAKMLGTPDKRPYTLQMRKNSIRRDLAEKGIIQREGVNKFDKYKYFSEAQYKKLFTELFAYHGIELATTVLQVDNIDGTNKQPFGRRAIMQFTLIDILTGESEVSVFVGEGIDNGDKALYKAYTGALKYFYASVFNVATGDDPEKNESTEAEEIVLIQPWQLDIIRKTYADPAIMTKLLETNGLSKLEDMTFDKAKSLIDTIKERAKTEPRQG